MLAIRFVKMKDGNRIYRSYFFNRKSMLSLSLSRVLFLSNLLFAFWRMISSSSTLFHLSTSSNYIAIYVVKMLKIELYVVGMRTRYEHRVSRWWWCLTLLKDLCVWYVSLRLFVRIHGFVWRYDVTSVNTHLQKRGNEIGASYNALLYC